MTKSKNLTMSDIARLAGVSEATVSRALKNSELINKETRLRVQAIAREHNYKVNTAARNFRTQKTHTLAVVLLVDKEWGHEVSDAFLMVLLGSIADEAAHHGYDLLLSTNPHDIDDLADYYIDSKRADGLIIIGQGRNDPRLDRLAESGRPFIVWGARCQNTIISPWAATTAKAPMRLYRCWFGTAAPALLHGRRTPPRDGTPAGRLFRRAPRCGHPV